LLIILTHYFVAESDPATRNRSSRDAGSDPDPPGGNNI